MLYIYRNIWDELTILIFKDKKTIKDNNQHILFFFLLTFLWLRSFKIWKILYIVCLYLLGNMGVYEQ